MGYFKYINRLGAVVDGGLAVALYSRLHEHVKLAVTLPQLGVKGRLPCVYREFSQIGHLPFTVGSVGGIGQRHFASTLDIAHQIQYVVAVDHHARTRYRNHLRTASGKRERSGAFPHLTGVPLGAVVPHQAVLGNLGTGRQ